MSDYIYLYCDRVIYWQPYSAFYQPVAGFPFLTCYLVNKAPPLPLEDMVLNENYSFDLRQGFFMLQDEPVLAWNERENTIKKIMIMERFHDLANTQRLHYTNNSIGQSLTDILVLDEIREFRRTGNLKNCLILTARAETIDASLSPEALATKLWLQYESYRAVVAYLTKLEFDIRLFLTNNRFDDANELLIHGFEKMGV